MFFPWVGLFEQIRLADVYVHYDDVQLPQGRSFVNRVQIKTPSGIQWLTAPVKRGSQLIRDVRFDGEQRWRDRHLSFLRHSLARTPYCDDALEIAEAVYGGGSDFLWEFNRQAIEAISSYFDFHPIFLVSSDFAVDATGTEKLISLVQKLEGTIYVTGHGAKNYLDHAQFEALGIGVEYMNYRKVAYPQRHGDFTPFVSVLDLIANAGTAGRSIICSETVSWKEFVA